tara:strand:+ start:15025 stop:16098 length:1074 start_codon:yes stop_codon:yes gene_type:complete
MNKIVIIAEAGVNHNGELSLAKELIKVAAKSGADFVKFQTFDTDELVTKSANQAPYQYKNSGIKESQYKMLKKLELSKKNFVSLKKECKKRGIGFLSTPFDLPSLKFLSQDMNLHTIKIPSGEITNLELILEASKLKRSLIISTGMANLEEIELALAAAAFGFSDSKQHISVSSFKKAFLSRKGKMLLKRKVSLLHCTSNYPADPKDINLNAMKSLKEVFNLPVGYSDHSQGIEVSVAAAAMGAKIIEKHFTIDKNLPGPDHLASLNPEELKDLVISIRNIEKALGDGIKIPKRSELTNKKIARKSIFAAKEIRKGEIITREKLKVKRPEIGLRPSKIWDLIGSKAKKDYHIDEVFK